MSLSLAAWAASVDGHYIDVDGAFGAQCHDLWLDYGYRVVGMGHGQGWAPGNGDTVNVLTGFPAVRGLDAHFTRHWGIDGIRAGDVAFWYRSAWFPGSHVAVALGPPVGELLPTMTQNPGPTKHANLITRGFAGYLRPIRSSAGGSARPVKKVTGVPMFNLIRVPDAKLIYVQGIDGRREGVQSADHLKALMRLRDGMLTPGDPVTIYFGDLVGQRGHIDWYLARVNGPRADRPKDPTVAPAEFTDEDIERIANAIVDKTAERLKK